MRLPSPHRAHTNSSVHEGMVKGENRAGIDGLELEPHDGRRLARHGPVELQEPFALHVANSRAERDSAVYSYVEAPAAAEIEVTH